ncbi:LOB domain-containing protein 36-like [Impatiens glandulifera]|uniref:LOB domain-containing protein 36-like n=1 Tax=Impatiens glandulifera TaxID=253017 RepID=UPI001FB061A3|nr:LOB domain-containing protein 36-like [Impatiens glandulifera]
MSSSNSPCAACKFLRRKCMPECVFAPYFPPDNPQKFSNVHKVFGASNVSKILNDLSPNNREDAVSSLAFEAEFRLRDPVYGCVGLISSLQKRISQIQQNLHVAKKELATYIDPTVMLQTVPHSGYHLHQQQHMNNHPSQVSAMGFNMQQMFAVQNQNPVSQHQHMIETSQQLAMESFQQQQQQLQSHELVKFNINGYDQSGQVGFNLMDPSPSLALGGGGDGGSFEGVYNNNNNHHHLLHQQQHEQSKIQNLHFQSQLMINQQQQQHQSSSQHAHDMLLQPKSVNE